MHKYSNSGDSAFEHKLFCYPTKLTLFINVTDALGCAINIIVLLYISQLASKGLS